MSELLFVTEPVVRLPLDTLRTTGKASALFRVPDTKRWNDLRAEWGEPNYVVFAHRSEGGTPFIQPFSKLGVVVHVSINGRALQLEPVSEPPYSFSSRTTDYGVAFHGTPGAELRVDVGVGDSPNLPDGELSIEPQWPGELKDRMVGAMLEESLQPYVAGLGILGVLLVFGALMLPRQRAGDAMSQ